MLSASDIETYRTCPLKYKFARVFRIPQEPTINQRFGILVHQVLERFHVGDGRGRCDEMLGLLEAGWRRGGFGDTDEERQLHGKATRGAAALPRALPRTRTPSRCGSSARSRSSSAPHLLRGRVDRVDRLPDGALRAHRLQDRPPEDAGAAARRRAARRSTRSARARRGTSRPRSRPTSTCSTTRRCPLPRGEVDREWIADTVFDVAEGILGQGFEPTPSYAACSMCDYRIVCPAAER